MLSRGFASTPDSQQTPFFPLLVQGPHVAAVASLGLGQGRAPPALSLDLYFHSESGLELGPSSHLPGLCLIPWNAESFPLPPASSCPRCPWKGVEGVKERGGPPGL